MLESPVIGGKINFWNDRVKTTRKELRRKLELCQGWNRNLDRIEAGLLRYMP